MTDLHTHTRYCYSWTIKADEHTQIDLLMDKHRKLLHLDY